MPAIFLSSSLFTLFKIYNNKLTLMKNLDSGTGWAIKTSLFKDRSFLLFSFCSSLFRSSILLLSLLLHSGWCLMRLVTQLPIPLAGGVTMMANIYYHYGNFTVTATPLPLRLLPLALLIHTLFGLQLYRTVDLTGMTPMLRKAETVAATATTVSALPWQGTVYNNRL